MDGNSVTRQFCGRCGTLVQELGADCPGCLLELGVVGETPPSEDELRTALARRFPAYDFEDRIGRGGMGVVLRARHRRLDRVVAAKVLSHELQKAPGFTERFEREARAMAALSHPGIVQVHDFGVEQDAHVLFLEYVHGATLRDLMADGPLSSTQAVEILAQICAALDYAHSRGVVHRDIKPENVLVDENGRVKVADFGLARLVGDTSSLARLTMSRHVLGTPHYMAPEQMQSAATVDHRADLFSLGVLFYEMLTGGLPLGRFAPPSARAGSDPSLDAVVMRLLEQEPCDRFASASEVLAALSAARGSSVANVAARTAAPQRSSPLAAAETMPSPLQQVLRGWPQLPAGIALVLYAFPWFDRSYSRSNWKEWALETDLGDLAFVLFLVVFAAGFFARFAGGGARGASLRRASLRTLWATELLGGALSGIALFALAMDMNLPHGDRLYPILVMFCSGLIFVGGIVRFAARMGWSPSRLLRHWPRLSPTLAAQLGRVGLLFTCIAGVSLLSRLDGLGVGVAVSVVVGGAAANVAVQTRHAGWIALPGVFGLLLTAPLAIRTRHESLAALAVLTWLLCLAICLFPPRGPQAVAAPPAR